MNINLIKICIRVFLFDWFFPDSAVFRDGWKEKTVPDCKKIEFENGSSSKFNYDLKLLLIIVGSFLSRYFLTWSARYSIFFGKLF